MANREANNLKRWAKTGRGYDWVREHSARWDDAGWQALLGELKSSSYWPMFPDNIGVYLDSLARQYQQERSQVLADSNARPLKQALSGYVVGLAFIGLACGFFAGASHTPVVATLLPLLFALIGGGSGIYLASADLAASATLTRLHWLGLSLASFGITVLAGSAAGIYLRLHYEQSEVSKELLNITKGKAQDAIELAALRSKLRMLGASASDQDHVLTVAAAAINIAKQPIAATQVRRLASESHQLETELKSLRSKAEAAGNHAPDDVNELVTALNLFGHQTEPWIDSGMPRYLYKNATESIYYHIGRVVFPVRPETAEWVGKTGFDTRNMYRLFAALNEEFEMRDDLDWELGGPKATSLDKVLQLVTKTAKLGQDTDQIMPDIDDSVPKDKNKPETKTP